MASLHIGFLLRICLFFDKKSMLAEENEEIKEDFGGFEDSVSLFKFLSKIEFNSKLSNPHRHAL